MFFPVAVVVMALFMFALMFPWLWIAYGITLLLAIAYVVSADRW